MIGVVEAELRSQEKGQIANALGGIAEALAHVIVYAAEGDPAAVQDLLNTSARVVVIHARAMLEVLKPPPGSKH